MGTYFARLWPHLWVFLAGEREPEVAAGADRAPAASAQQGGGGEYGEPHGAENTYEEEQVAAAGRLDDQVRVRADADEEYRAAHHDPRHGRGAPTPLLLLLAQKGFASLFLNERIAFFKLIAFISSDLSSVINL